MRRSVALQLIDPATRPTRSPISTNQRRKMLLFLVRIFILFLLSHTLVAGTTNNGSAHRLLTQSGFVVFGSIATTQQSGCMGAYRIIDLEQFPVRISNNKAPTPLTTSGILFFTVFLFRPFFFFFFHCFSFFLCIAFSDPWRFSPF